MKTSRKARPWVSLTGTWFRTGEVVDITGVSKPCLQTWMAQGLILGQDSVGRGGFGRHRFWTFNNLMEVATAKALIDAGMTDLKSVFGAAAHFAQTDRILPGYPPRNLGLPVFTTTGVTILVAGPQRADVIFLDVEPNASSLDQYQKILGPQTCSADGPAGCVVVNMNRVFDRLACSIGLSAPEVFAAEYA